MAELSDKTHYENYVGTIYFKHNMTSVEEHRFYSSASCGYSKLEQNEGLSFLGVEGEESGCGFYQQKFSDIKVVNDVDEGEVSFTMAFERKFSESHLTPWKRSGKIIMRGGFKIFDDFSELRSID